MPSPADGEPLVAYVAANVRRLRDAKGWTQQQLAAEVDADDRYVRRIESGKVNLTLVMLARLGRALGVPPAQLLRPASWVPHAPGRPRKRRE